MVLKTIETYQPVNEQETVDKQAIISFIKQHDDALERHNKIAHLTSSALVVNETFDKVLFAHHNIYDAWGWVGGHTDGDPNLLKVAIKEAKEETGIEVVRAYDGKIFALDTIFVENHIKHGAFVPDHLHLNVTYLLIADDNQPLAVKPDENSAVRWFDIDTVLKHVNEPRMMPVYQKLFTKLQSLK